MAQGTVYHVFNTINGKSYVGQTWKSLEDRWVEHRKSSSGCRALRSAIERYGPEAFVLSTLVLVDEQNELDAAEVYWIGYFGSLSPGGYNLRTGGRARGKMSAESKAKLSASKMGHGVSAEVRAKISKKVSKTLMGNKRSLGWKPPQEFLDKMTEINRRRAQDPEDRRRKSEGTRLWWAKRKAAVNG